MQQITAMFARVWEFFQLTEPHLGISYGAIYLGVFVIGMSCRFLIPLLGLGGSGVDISVKSTNRVFNWRDERRRNLEMQKRRENQALYRRMKNYKVNAPNQPRLRSRNR